MPLVSDILYLVHLRLSKQLDALWTTYALESKVYLVKSKHRVYEYNFNEKWGLHLIRIQKLHGLILKDMRKCYQTMICVCNKEKIS